MSYRGIREDSKYCEWRYWALGDLAKTMTPLQATIIRALSRDHYTWRGIMMVAIEEMGWDIDRTQMAGEQLCILAAEILGCKSTEFVGHCEIE